MSAADPTPTPQTSPAGGTKPDAGEPVTVTSKDGNVAMSVAYKLAVQDVTHDDQYRHEAAKIVALHRQQAVAEATAELRAELDNLKALVLRLKENIARSEEAFEALSTILAKPSRDNLELRCAYQEAEGRALDCRSTLATAPESLRDHVVIPRAEYERLKGGK